MGCVLRVQPGPFRGGARGLQRGGRSNTVLRQSELALSTPAPQRENETEQSNRLNRWLTWKVTQANKATHANKKLSTPYLGRLTQPLGGCRPSASTALRARRGGGEHHGVVQRLQHDGVPSGIVA